MPIPMPTENGIWSEPPLVVHTIFDHPSDFPCWWVVRVCEMRGGRVLPTPEFAVCPSLESARATSPPWKVNIGRDNEDDPVIYESWIRTARTRETVAHRASSPVINFEQTRVDTRAHHSPSKPPIPGRRMSCAILNAIGTKQRTVCGRLN
jgi:hypothetical protein